MGFLSNLVRATAALSNLLGCCEISEMSFDDLARHVRGHGKGITQ